MRSIATAAREAVQGSDESLWQACMERVKEDIPRRTVMLIETDYMRLNEFELVIKEMSPQERALYGVSDE